MYCMRAEGQELKPSPEVSRICACACFNRFLIFKPGQGSYLESGGKHQLYCQFSAINLGDNTNMAKKVFYICAACDDKTPRLGHLDLLMILVLGAEGIWWKSVF